MIRSYPAIKPSCICQLSERYSKAGIFVKENSAAIVAQGQGKYPQLTIKYKVNCFIFF